MPAASLATVVATLRPSLDVAVYLTDLDAAGWTFALASGDDDDSGYAVARPPQARATLAAPPAIPGVRLGYGDHGAEVVVDGDPDRYYGETVRQWQSALEFSFNTRFRMGDFSEYDRRLGRMLARELGLPTVDRDELRARVWRGDAAQTYRFARLARRARARAGVNY